ncbi:TonB-dependent receptor domain-containing protein [Sphingomonas sp.]|uniref:TonB-dependent receptor n=1 Tax=Sphingomonas sp. TaxID=28214 RepID=UPI00286C7003|nr:TonB-dependent receptor [Sphingomonas sp.]
MTKSNSSRGLRRNLMLRSLLLGVSSVTMITVVAVPAAAQTTTTTISGQVTDAAGAAVAGAVVSASDVATGQTVKTTTDSNGHYTLAGLRPADYTIRTTIGGATVERQVSASIGQSATLDLAPAAVVAEGAPATAAEGDIVVTGRRLVETKTSEVATNVTQEQIRSLPQTDRNFLSFAKLAPGVNYVDSETNKGITSGASTRSAVNVFIDGVSLKNQILDGGIAGQQDSRGNPFGQLAVQEFRVLTQNYKAEYEQAAAAVITAVTKSGTNEFHGEVFGQYTDKKFAETDYFVKKRGDPEPKFKRVQYGAALGGPIIKDRLFFFGTYEGNDQDRAFNVILGNRSPANIARFGQFEGAFVSPFRGDFFFGKLTALPADNHVIDLSYSRRQETDIQGFGGTTAFTAAENKHNTVDTVNAKWTYRGDAFLNEADVNYIHYLYNPTSLDTSSPTFDYAGVIIIGGKDSTQDLTQDSLTLRDELTWTGIDRHTIKGGIRLAKHKYDFNKLFFVQPRFTFFQDLRGPGPGDDLDFSFPAEAQLGFGNPEIKAKNSAVGLFVQDDWAVTDKLELNLGLRWDYESNMFNNKYVTPAIAAATLRALPQTDYFNAEDYITDGTNRDPYLGMFQPRLGFSYDFKGDRSTVLFGGYGRYFDRNVFNNTLDESYRLQYTIGRFFFSRDGVQRDGNPTVVWNDSYLTREGLLALQSTGQTGKPELFAVPNNAKPPRTDQFSLGVRQRFGQWVGSVTGSYIRGVHGYTHLFATRRNGGTGDCCDTAIANANGFANVLIGFDGLDTRYKGLYVTMDKPYTRASGWGVNIAYTLSKAEQNGNDLFSLDKVTPDDWGFRPRPGDERHKVVVGAMIDAPYGFRVSTLSQFGSGAAYQIQDQTAGSDINLRQFRSGYPDKNCFGGLFAFCEVNLTVENELKIYRGTTINLAVDFLNVFNSTNFAGFDDFVSPTDPLLEPKIGNRLITLPRRIQFRAGFRF